MRKGPFTYLRYVRVYTLALAPRACVRARSDWEISPCLPRPCAHLHPRHPINQRRQPATSIAASPNTVEPNGRFASSPAFIGRDTHGGARLCLRGKSLAEQGLSVLYPVKDTVTLTETSAAWATNGEIHELNLALRRILMRH